MNVDQLRLRTRLDLPPRGGSVRVSVGGNELILEAARGAYTVLWHAGREARRYFLGLDRGDHVSLELRPPALPVRLLLRETLALAPGARIRGYVQVPLVPTLVLQSAQGRCAVMMEFGPGTLTAELDDSSSAVQCCSSSWFVRYPMHGGDPRVTIPLRLGNGTDAVCSPAEVPLFIEASELVELRSGIVAPPRRLIWNGSLWHENVALRVEVSA